MGSLRARLFDAVIGIGGVSGEPQRAGMARKLTWVGLGPHRIDRGPPWRGPIVLFDHFLYCAEDGPLLESLAPALSARMYGRPVRGGIIHTAPGAEKEPLDQEVKAILDRARDAPPSFAMRRGFFRR